MALALLLAGCAQPTRQPVQEQELVWPARPAAPRIAFVREFATPDDLGIKRGFWKWLSDVFTGGEDLHLVRPMAVLVARAGLIYVADPGAGAVHRFDTVKGKHLLIKRADGRPLVSPVGLALDSRGLVYVTDSDLNAVFTIAPEAEVATPLALAAPLEQPTGIAIDPVADRVFVVETAAHRVSVFSRDGQLLARHGGRGNGDGEFNFPTLIWNGTGGLLYVTDALNFRVQILEKDGRFLGLFGEAGDGTGHMSRPKGVATDRNGHVYVVDTLFHTVQIFDARGNFLLNFGNQGQKAGEFWMPTGIFIADNDTIYIADSH
ncbi:MAG: 6-bladed beta-propeller, partial [Pseudomonadota bacterium]